jgi:hypothetical protein
MAQWVLTNASDEKQIGPMPWNGHIRRDLGLLGNQNPPDPGYTANGLTLRNVTRTTGDGGEYASGNAWVIETPAPTPQVPAFVLRSAALAALAQADPPITEASILAKIALISDPTERAAMTAGFNEQRWYRNSSTVSYFAGEYGLSNGDLDALFIAAFDPD